MGQLYDSEAKKHANAIEKTAFEGTMENKVEMEKQSFTNNECTNILRFQTNKIV